MDVIDIVLSKKYTDKQIAEHGGGSYVLPIATSEKLGGIKVGKNFSINENGVLDINDDELIELMDSNIATKEEIDNILKN